MLGILFDLRTTDFQNGGNHKYKTYLSGRMCMVLPQYFPKRVRVTSDCSISGPRGSRQHSNSTSAPEAASAVHVVSIVIRIPVVVPIVIVVISVAIVVVVVVVVAVVVIVVVALHVPRHVIGHAHRTDPVITKNSWLAVTSVFLHFLHFTSDVILLGSSGVVDIKKCVHQDVGVSKHFISNLL